jgi:hypothetical protein
VRAVSGRLSLMACRWHRPGDLVQAQVHPGQRAVTDGVDAPGVLGHGATVDMWSDMVQVLLIYREGSQALMVKNVKVVTVKGDRAAQRTIESMLAAGWELDAQSSRKMAWRMTTGVFTKKQKHTMTFIRRPAIAQAPWPPEAPQAPQAIPTPAGWYPHPQTAGVQIYWDGMKWSHEVGPDTGGLRELKPPQPSPPQPSTGESADRQGEATP